MGSDRRLLSLYSSGSARHSQRPAAAARRPQRRRPPSPVANTASSEHTSIRHRRLPLPAQLDTILAVLHRAEVPNLSM